MASSILSLTTISGRSGAFSRRIASASGAVMVGIVQSQILESSSRARRNLPAVSTTVATGKYPARRRCWPTAEPEGLELDTDLDALATACHVKIDDLLKASRIVLHGGRPSGSP